MSDECVYCGCDVSVHAPVYVAEGGERDPVGGFCNYGCLWAYIREEDLAVGTVCRID
ncbi:hypothetical protein [Halegenticoccus soli]|uniref:hypothetical protein n=1 Tax=Halegenticoccus soli TaxID=1985678 RepID=UPI0018EAD7A1|nr:hypothetical protein [Halegenticoccus soli]